MTIGRHYTVRGRVQRVGYRMFVEDAARREGLRGYVRNHHDGSVEIVAEGEADAMARFEMAIHRGPLGARVDHVTTSDVEPSGQHHTFSVTS